MPPRHTIPSALDLSVANDSYGRVLSKRGHTIGEIVKVMLRRESLSRYGHAVTPRSPRPSL